jgi:hypothetical protein
MTSASRVFRLPVLVLPMTVVAALLSMLAAGSASGAACGGGGRLVIPAGSTVSFSNCTVSGNMSAGLGGGVENHGDLTLTDVVVSGNTAVDGGGGIYNSGALTLVNVIVTDNMAGDVGGGILNESATLYMSNVTVTGNTASGGGGGIANLDGSAIGVALAVSGNTATTGDGGGILNVFGTFSLCAAGANPNVCDTNLGGGNSLLTGNHASTGNGGGIANDLGSTLTLTDSTVDDNHAEAGHGGGIWSVLATTFIVNATISNNTATGNGGGLFNDSSSVCCAGVSIYDFNLTIAGNHTDGDGGGAYTTGGGFTMLASATIADNTANGSGGGVFDDSSFTELQDTLLARNGTNCAGAITSMGHNLDTGNTCAFTEPGDQSNVGDANVGLDKKLAANGGPPQGSSELSAPMMTQALADTSPAIDAGSATCPATDERGVPRPQDGDQNGTPGCDIGAFELQPCLTVDKSCSVESVYACTKPITALTLQLDGGYPQCVRITAVVANGAPLQEIDDICPGGDVVTVNGYDGSLGNDVIWNVYRAGTTGTDGFLGQSSFHLSCSDQDMNSADDCEKLEGDNKGKSGFFLNIWRLAGISGPTGSGPSASLMCPGFPGSGQIECNASPAPYACTKPITALTMKWTGAQTITSISAQVTKSATTILTGPFVTGDTVTVGGYDGSLGNDVLWDITFQDGTTGQSSFHLSCSDQDMNGADDCGKLEGDNKGSARCLPGNDNASCIDLWAFEGMQGPIGSAPSASLDCAFPSGTAPVTYSYVITNISNDPVTNIMVTDEVTDQTGTRTMEVCGPPFNPFTLGPGETRTCSVVADVGSETTDIATATGDGCSPAQSNEVTVNVAGGAGSLCPTAATMLTAKDRDVKWEIEAPATNAVQIGKIEITFPAGANGALREVKLKGDAIFKGSLSSPGTITSFSGNAKKRTIKKGKTEELKFHFREKVAESGYDIAVTFTNGCVLQIAN